MSIARTRVSLYPCPTPIAIKLREAQLFPASHSVLVLLTSGTHGREICEIPEGPECGNQGRCCWHCPRLRLVQSPWVLPRGLWNVSGTSGFLHGRLSLRAWESWEVPKVIPALSSHFRTRAISAWEWGVGEHPAAGLRVTLKKRRPHRLQSRAKKRESSQYHPPHYAEKERGVCVFVHVCML